jgi:hypothetical protein
LPFPHENPPDPAGFLLPGDGAPLAGLDKKKGPEGPFLAGWL